MKKIFFAVLIFGYGGIFAQANNANHKNENVNTAPLPGIKTTDKTHDAVNTQNSDMKLTRVEDKSHDASAAHPVTSNPVAPAKAQRTSPHPYKAPTGAEAEKNGVKRPVQVAHNGPTLYKEPTGREAVQAQKHPAQPVHNGPTPYKAPSGKEAKTK